MKYLRWRIASLPRQRARRFSIDPLSLKNRSRIFADDMFQSTDSYIIIGIKEKCRKFF